MWNDHRRITRFAFLRESAALAAGALAAGAIAAAGVPALARPASGAAPRRHPFKHPEPRPGITAERVLPDARLPADDKVRAAFASVRGNPAIYDGIYCTCRCQKSHGHRSLLACYETEQPTGCQGCQEEAAFVARQIAGGKALPAIR